MLFLLMLGLYMILVKKLVITRNFSLHNEAARNYGIALLIATIPLTIVFNYILHTVLPQGILAVPLYRGIVNALILFAIGIGLALPFREKPTKPYSGASITSESLRIPEEKH